MKINNKKVGLLKRSPEILVKFNQLNNKMYEALLIN